MELENFSITRIIEKILKKEVEICALCGATAALGEAGLLDERKHTRNDEEYLKIFCQYYNGSENYINDQFLLKGI